MSMERRKYKGFSSKVITTIAVLTSLYAIAYLAGLFRTLGVLVTPAQHSLIFLAFLFTLSFLIVPAKKGLSSDVLPWYDALFIVLGWTVCMYAVILYIPLENRMASLETQDVAVALILLALVFEMVRRVIGWGLVTVMLLFLAYINFAYLLPGWLRGPGLPISGWIGVGALSAQGIPGIALKIAATIIFLFVFFGELLRVVGAEDLFKNIAFGLAGRYRGGPAKASVIASGLFGSISGSTSANIATTGTFTIPIMKRIGYRPEYAGAVEAAASNGGQIMPPIMGAVAFIMAEILHIPYLSVVAAAILPALLYFFAVFLMVDFEAASRNIAGLPASELPSAKAGLKKGWYCILPVALLIYLLLIGFTIETAGLYCTALFLPMLFIGNRQGANRLKMALNKLKEALSAAPKTLLTAGVACAGVGVMVAAVSITGVGLRLSTALVDFSGGNLYFLMFLTAACCFVLGMGMGSVPAYIIVALMVAPALIELGIVPIAAHLYVFYWSLTAFLTPPVCIGAFVAAAIAQTEKVMQLGWQSMKLAFVGFMPVVFVLKPALILKGSLGEITLVFVFALIGTIALASGIQG
ncbi:TRAP transporter permease, partial [Chloroflexota bacterium]